MSNRSNNLAGVIAKRSGCRLQPPRIELNSSDRTSMSLENRSARFCSQEVLTHGKWAGTWGKLGVASGSIGSPLVRAASGMSKKTQNNLDRVLRTGSL